MGEGYEHTENGVCSMPGERRLVSIKSLIESIGLKIASIGGTVNTNITNNPLKVDDVQTPLTITQVQFALNASPIIILAPNANRKYLIIRNTSQSDATVYIHFDASTATPGNSLYLKKGEYFEFPEDFIYTGEIRALSSGWGSDAVSVLEGV